MPVDAPAPGKGMTVRCMNYDEPVPDVLDDPTRGIYLVWQGQLADNIEAAQTLSGRLNEHMAARLMAVDHKRTLDNTRLTLWCVQRTEYLTCFIGLFAAVHHSPRKGSLARANRFARALARIARTRPGRPAVCASPTTGRAAPSRPACAPPTTSRTAAGSRG